MRKIKSCKRPTYKKLLPWLPAQYIGNTNLCNSPLNPKIITPCPNGCRCQRQQPKRVWQPAQAPIYNWFGIMTVPPIPAYWRYVAQPSRCMPVGNAQMTKY